VTEKAQPVAKAVENFWLKTRIGAVCKRLAHRAEERGASEFACTALFLQDKSAGPSF
jgi:hypothetical protein